MANRFWVAQPVSGAIVSVTSPPQVRLTVASTSGMTTGDVRTVFGVGGTTEANGTWTITVIDGTHIDLQGTTFANVYTSGGSVNGKWDASNTNNWVTTSGGSNYGQTVPGSSDAVTFDGSSGGNTVTVNGDLNITSLTMGAFTGTLDFSANNNNVTAQTVNISGTGTRTLNLGNGTFTLTGTGNAWFTGTITNLTFAANSSTILLSGTPAATRTFAGGGLTFNIISIAANTGSFTTAITGANTIATLSIAAPNNIIFASSVTQTVTNAFNWAGSSGSEILVIGQTNGTAATISVASGAPTMAWAALRDMTFSGGGTFTATSSFGLGNTTGITITPPSGGGGLLSQGEMMGGMVG